MSRAKTRVQDISKPTFQWECRTNISIFVRCLHLLDLDLLEDWPEISEQTFSTRSVQQNTQQRQRGVEWSLYRLFERYDADLTKEKLQPFFPPMTSLQSLNLRAALLRSLTELKKNGVLGRDVILRKTMLDECKGDKFEELISVFAMLVLKNHRQVEIGYSTTRLLEHIESKSDEQCVPLIIAHRAALQKQLHERKSIQENARIYRQVLEEQLARTQKRKEELRQLNEKPDVQLQRQAKRMLQDVWIGDADWVPELLYGNSKLIDKLAIPPTAGYGEPMFENDSQPKIVPVPLLDQVNTKIESHQQRLSRWQKFHDALPVPIDSEQNDRVQTMTETRSESRFAKHQHLDWAFIQNKFQHENLTAHATESEYRGLLDRLENELCSVPSSTSRETGRNSNGIPKLHNNLPSCESSLSREDCLNTSSEHGLNSEPEPKLEEDLDASCTTIEQAQNPFDLSSIPQGATMTGSPDTPGPKIRQSRAEAVEPPEEENATVYNTFIEDKPVKDNVVPPPAEQSVEYTPSLRKSSAGGSNVSEATRGLLERTRRSMASITTPQVNFKKPKDKRLSQVYPINQFETPRSSKMLAEIPTPNSGASTPRDKLFEEGADYASIFKSRPKIAMSPVLSPERTSLDLEDSFDLDMERINLNGK